MLAQAAGTPIRVASKSVRSTALLRLIGELDPGFQGILAFTLPEALWLAAQGFEDIVVAYPTADRTALAELVELAARDPERAPVPMVDSPPHLDLIESAIHGGAGGLRVCLDLDVGWWPAKGRLARIGPKRSPVTDACPCPADGGRDLREAGHPAGGRDGLRRPDRGGRRPRPGEAAQERRDPLDAGRIGARDPAAPAPPDRRGQRARRSRVRERRGNRERGANRGRRRGDRGDRRIGLLRAGAVRRLPLPGPEAGGLLRAAGGAPAKPHVRNGAGRRLPGLGRSRERTGSRGPTCRRDSTSIDRRERARSRRRSGASGRGGFGSAIASTCATPRRASCASGSARSIWSRAIGSPTRSRPTGARARRSSEPMSSVLAYTSPARGHLFPLVPLLDELGRRGHRVSVRTLPSQVGLLRERGFEADPISPEIEAIHHDDWKARTAQGAFKRGVAIFGARAEHEVPDLEGAIEATQPDLLLIDVQTWGAAAVAESSGLPWAMWCPYPLPIPSRDAPPFGPGLRPARGRVRPVARRRIGPALHGVCRAGGEEVARSAFGRAWACRRSMAPPGCSPPRR